MTRQSLMTWMDYLFIPAGILAGFLLKHSDLKSRGDKAAYLTFSSAAAWYCPSLTQAFFPEVSANVYGFFSFVAGVYGGLILFNGYRLIVDNASLWRGLIRKYMGGKP